MQKSKAYEFFLFVISFMVIRTLLTFLFSLIEKNAYQFSYVNDLAIPLFEAIVIAFVLMIYKDKRNKN